LLLALELLGKLVFVFDVLQIWQLTEQIRTSLRTLEMDQRPFSRRYRIACDALKLAAKPGFIDARW
jgi:hypothetical protein